MTIWGVSVVKDEADIICGTLAHLNYQGVKSILIADNGSTDRTRPLIEHVRDSFLWDNFVIHDDRDPAWYQARKINALATEAATLGASWIVPFDADEWWYGTEGRTVADALLAAPADVLYARTWDYVDREHRRPVPKPLPKVAYRWCPEASIGEGNHDVAHPGRQAHGWLEIREFQYRSLEQFRRKVRNGAQALALTSLPETVGTHWRVYGQMTDEQLADEWARLSDRSKLVYDPV